MHPQVAGLDALLQRQCCAHEVGYYCMYRRSRCQPRDRLLHSAHHSAPHGHSLSRLGWLNKTPRSPPLPRQMSNPHHLSAASTLPSEPNCPSLERFPILEPVGSTPSPQGIEGHRRASESAALPFVNHHPRTMAQVHNTRKSSISTHRRMSVHASDHKPSHYTIPTFIAPPWSPSLEPYGVYSSKQQPSRFGARMPSDRSVYKSHWLSRLRSALRLLIIVLSGAVAVTLVHTLNVYRGNKFLDLRHGELPMTWPARTNLAPTLILLSIAALNFLASVAIMSVSFTKSFRRPMRSRDIYRIVAGSFGVILWATALVVFHLLDKASKASLGRYACTHKNVMSNGRYQYRAVCEEQVRWNLECTWRVTANISPGSCILPRNWRRLRRSPHSHYARRLCHPLRKI
jgi:hypothetical protein